MKKIFTPKNNQKKVVAPSEQTLDFLKQFARSYFVEKKLPQQVNGVCMN